MRKYRLPGYYLDEIVPVRFSCNRKTKTRIVLIPFSGRSGLRDGLLFAGIQAAGKGQTTLGGVNRKPVVDTTDDLRKQAQSERTKAAHDYPCIWGI